jgi:hypothetical protein
MDPSELSNLRVLVAQGILSEEEFCQIAGVSPDPSPPPAGLMMQNDHTRSNNLFGGRPPRYHYHRRHHYHYHHHHCHHHHYHTTITITATTTTITTTITITATTTTITTTTTTPPSSPLSGGGGDAQSAAIPPDMIPLDFLPGAPHAISCPDNQYTRNATSACCAFSIEVTGKEKGGVGD